MTKRLDYVDIARGLAILYIIECHVCDYHVAWIDSWSMPIFFIIMGLFFKPTKTWKEMVIKKARTILLPFFLLSIPSYIQYIIQLGPIGLFYRVVDPFNCCHGVGWFLICMFWCYLIYYTIHRMVKGKMYIKLTVCLIISLVFFYISTWRPDILSGHRLVLPYFMSTSLTCISFISVGELLKKQLLRNRIETYKLLVYSVIMGGVIVNIFGCKGGAMIVNDYYGQPYVLWFANSILGSIAILEICKYLPIFIAFFGKHSLLMLMVHPYVKRIIFLFCTPSILTFIIVVAITTLLVFALAKYLPITEGKLRNT